MKADVLVLGAGIVGVSAALHLQERGRSVVLVDRREPGEGTSFGNAGLIERASVIPYAFPRDWRALAKYALNRRSDVRYDPLHLLRIAPWLFRYWRNSAPDRLGQTAREILPLIEASVSEHDRLVARAGAGNLVSANGFLTVFRSPRHFAAAQAALEGLKRFDLRTRVLDRAALLKLEPVFAESAASVAGALHWLDPKTVHDPEALVKAYHALFLKEGGRFRHADAATLRHDGGGWALESTEGETLSASQAVVALGPQSGTVFRKFGYRLPLEVKRGHHRHYRQPEGAPLGHSILDEEAGFVLAPMRRGIRLTTGVEFAAPHAPPNAIQLSRAEAVARSLVPLGAPVEETPWLGLRPCLPDMKPVIGEAPRHKGLWFLFGHAHHGLTLGPASGRLLAELMTGETPFANPAPFGPERFG
ncbi:MAG: FAD-binding oxidoreductase [Methylobacterium mesophilicum]|nr:FAD-binding oxidoreductase [Methylobacterium mesophilicum]